MKKNNKEKKSEKNHVCSECGTAFYRPYRLAQHLLIHQNVKSFVCGEKDCNKSYTSKSHLDRHINSVHIAEKPAFNVIHSCPKCMKAFANRQNLKRHLKIKHNSNKLVFTCDVCKTDFKKKHLLSSHMYQHTFVKSFSCTMCNREFISLLERKKHMKHHKTYSCDDCDMAFVHWSKYQKHKKLDHTQEFVCNECGRKFKQRLHMVHHAKTHMLVKPKSYPCWFEDCKRVYSRQSNLKQHVEMKHLEIHYPCEICEAQLSSKASLKVHLKIHCRSEDQIKIRQFKTKESGRKERKDRGVPKCSTALKLAGLLGKLESDRPDSDVNSITKNQCKDENSSVELKCIVTNVEKSIESEISPVAMDTESLPTSQKEKVIAT